MRQSSKVEFVGWRDKDKDGQLDMEGQLFTDVSGLNFHTTSFINDKEKVGAYLLKYKEWTEAGVFTSSTIPSPNTSPPKGQSHIPTGKMGPDSQGRYFDTEADFLKTSSDDYGKWLTSKKNLDDAPIGVFKVKGQEYSV